MSATFDFRAHQERTRRASALLVTLFLIMAAAISLAIGFLVSFFLSTEDGRAIADPGEPGLDIDVLLVASGVTMAFIVGTAIIRVAAFGGDGSKVARTLGGEEVTEDTRSPAKRRYLNIVEEMSIAAGLPRPRAFVVMHEQGINAFAAGSSPQRAAIGITHGALAKLNRQELTGVIAHELAHIGNRDSRLNLRMMGMVYGLVILYVLGRGVLRSFIFVPRRRDGRTIAPALAIGLALVVLGLVGIVAGRILQSAVSRRRESLADATGVQFTRNPSGLANALKKIGANAKGSRVENSHTEEARHMFFASATGSFAGLFATHPPLVDRIRALEPTFDPARDPIWAKDDKAIMRETRRELVSSPWE